MEDKSKAPGWPGAELTPAHRGLERLNLFKNYEKIHQMEDKSSLRRLAGPELTPAHRGPGIKILFKRFFPDGLKYCLK